MSTVHTHSLPQSSPLPSRCLGCQSPDLLLLLRTPPLPICHDFGSRELFRLSLGQCRHCRLIQLLDGPNLERINGCRPDWLQPKEPDAHLAALVDRMMSFSPPQPDMAMLGLSEIDRTLLQRLEEVGYSPPTLARGFGAGQQNCLSQLTLPPATCQWIVGRNLLEHAPDPQAFVEQLRHWLAPEGLLLLEVPQSDELLRLRDYSLLWEEHQLYFTRATMANTLQRWGLSLVDCWSYPQAHQDCLMSIWRHGPGEFTERDGELEVGYGEDFHRVKTATANHIRELKQSHPKIALLGSGHLACTYVHLMEIAPWLDFIVDDDPVRQGLKFPGTDLAIVGSQVLLEQKVTLCLLGVNPQNQPAVYARQQGYLDSGGRFLSIFPDRQAKGFLGSGT